MTLAKMASEQLDDQLYTLTNGALSITVDAALGARITAFCLNGRNALVASGPQTGSTFWPAPQNAWGWPPPVALDSASYKVLASGSLMEFESEPCGQTGLQVRKCIELRAGSALISYSVRNISQLEQQWAPWEISRVPGGVTFYASAESPAAISTGPALHQDGVVWQQYRPQQQRKHEKIFGHNTAGWLANAHDGLLLLKRFAPIAASAQCAPGEAEVEIYAHCDAANPYVEVEQQGAYRCMAPGEEIHWQVEWLLSALPADTDYTAGNTRLTEHVRRILKLRG